MKITERVQQRLPDVRRVYAHVRLRKYGGRRIFLVTTAPHGEWDIVVGNWTWNKEGYAYYGTHPICDGGFIRTAWWFLRFWIRGRV